MLYFVLLFFHSLVRWVVLVAGAYALVRAVVGARAGRPYTAADALAGRLLVIALDTQLLLGLSLYAVGSPFTAVAFRDPAAAMKTTHLRFWLVEHPFAMLVAAALVHVGSVRVRRAGDAVARHRTASLFFGLALLAIAVGVPWPGLPYGRPLLRIF